MAVSILSQSSINNFYKYRNLAGPFADPVEYFVLGGGGAGSGNTGAGGTSQPGGGSGYYESGVLPRSTYSLSIGAGGAGISGTGSNGSPSTLGTVTADAGFRGVYSPSKAGDGGSGGSGGAQGLLGGINGADGNGSVKGLGSGKALLSWVPTSASTGFYGGGGTATGGSTPGIDAPAASGGGGEGSAVLNINIAPKGGNGGSGRIMFRYDTKYTILLGAGVTGTTATVSDKKVTTITAGTGTVSWA